MPAKAVTFRGNTILRIRLFPVSARYIFLFESHTNPPGLLNLAAVPISSTYVAENAPVVPPPPAYA